MIAKLFLAILIAAHIALGSALSGPAHDELLDTVQLQLSFAMSLALLAFIWLSVRVVLRRAKRPLRLLLRLSWSIRYHFAEGAAYLVAFGLVIQSYMMIKVGIPNVVPYYADPIIADLDATLFGTDPWRITHAIFGPTITGLLDSFYILPCAIVTIAMALWACFAKDREFSLRCVIAICLSWYVLGNWGAMALSSAGPVYYEHFYGSDRFAALAAALPDDLMASQTQAYLLDNFGNPGVGKGISAMPSMHNAIYLLLICMLYNRFGFGWQVYLAMAFELTVFVASVHLGWHYAMDGIVSALLTPAVWYFAGVVTRLRLSQTDSQGRGRWGTKTPQPQPIVHF